MRCIAFWLLHCSFTPVQAQDQLSTLLRQNRLPIAFTNGALSGPGGDLLRQAIASAQFVGIGEQHGTREVPEFASAVCRAMVPGGLDALAVEAGPLAVQELARWSAEPDGATKAAAWQAQHPWSVALFSWTDEFRFLGQCRQASSPHPLALWGLDQEFENATSFILPEIVRAHAGPEITAKAQALLHECDADWANAAASGDSRDLCILHAPPARFAELQSAAHASGNREAAQLAGTLVKTEYIYAAYTSGYGYESNRERALLLKQNFAADYTQLAARLGRPPRVLLKFGSNHITKGFDLSNLTNLGSFLSEFADERDLGSLHILIFGASGQQEVYVGPGKPDAAVAVDPKDLADLAPLTADLNGATLFDLRPIHPKLNALLPLPRELERVLLGFDFVVMLPHVTADPPLSAP